MRVMRVFIILVCCVSFNTYANFGLGPCCSGSPCGIVPCDNSCAGPALRAFGQEFFRGATRVNTQSVQVTSQNAGASLKSATFYSSLGQRLVLQTASLLRALDGLVSRYDGAISLTSDRWRRLSDNIGSQFEHNAQASASFKQVSHHSQRFDERAQGPSTTLLSERIDNQNAFFERYQIESALYLAALGHMQQTSDAIQARDTLRLVDQRLQNLNTPLMLVSPFTELSEATLAKNFYQLEHGNVENLVGRLNAQVLANRLSKKMSSTQVENGSLEDDWQVIRATPLVDLQYQQQLALATESGLLRESVLLQQQHAALLMEINQLGQQLNLVAAINQ